MKFVRKMIGALMITTFILITCNNIVYAQTLDQSVEAFEKMTDDYMKLVLEEYKVAGVAISVVKDGNVFFEKGYGYMDVKGKLPVTSDSTAFQIASVSKLFTATAAMQMVQQGKLSLDEDVNQYLTAFKIKNPYSKPVTLRYLLTHTAGFDYWVPLYLKTKGGEFFDELEPLEEILNKGMPEVIREPGTYCQYSTYGMSLAGYLVEVVSGMSIEDYITKNILEPLDMNHSSYRLNMDIIDNMSKPYKYKENKYLEDNYTVMSNHPSGSICASASDVAQFIIMHLNKGEYKGNSLLNRSIASKMHQHEYPKDERLTGFGLGFFETIRNGHRTIEHGGYLPPFSSKLTMLPEDNIGMFIAINTDSKKSSKVCNEFVDKFYDFFTSKPKNEIVKKYIPLDIDVNKVKGNYIFEGYGRNDLTKLKSVLLTCNIQCDNNDNLVFETSNMTCHYKYVGEGLFYSEKYNTYCKFYENHGKMFISILGFDYEKASDTNVKLFKMVIITLPLILITFLMTVISIIRKRKIHDKETLILKSLLSLSCIFIMMYYGLNGVMAIKSMMADTFIVFNFIIPLIKTVCYLLVLFTTMVIIFIIREWTRNKFLLRSKIFYSVIVITIGIHLVFMYIMNGFKL
ncbi:serine hydrolase domain-containing protein [Vallitalea okinawensis]|uniref:serine hydrolase domain-containing protein n=1 Tax=Vallitalea okinawensis TaxID=2078660 RepID=UPI000CFD48E2|nr:serine hydrolase domain-containing protein [Vallitalea okinawensis]